MPEPRRSPDLYAAPPIPDETRHEARRFEPVFIGFDDAPSLPPAPLLPVVLPETLTAALPHLPADRGEPWRRGTPWAPPSFIGFDEPIAAPGPDAASEFPAPAITIRVPDAPPIVPLLVAAAVAPVVVPAPRIVVEAMHDRTPPGMVRRHPSFGGPAIGIAAAAFAAAAIAAVVTTAGVPLLPQRLAARSAAPAARPAPAPAAPASPKARAAATLARAETGDPQAAQDIAVLYAEGDGVVQDYSRAATWFRAAAEKGVVGAEYNLAVLYERGLGVSSNRDEALAWYRRAAERGHPAAEYNLALAYADGRGTPQDYVQAAGWYQRAAEQGVVPAMVNFAILYERGQGVARSAEDAYAWYRAAAERGDAVADKRAEQLFTEFSARDRPQAAALAAAVAAGIHGPLPASSRPPALGQAAAPKLEQGWGRPVAQAQRLGEIPPRLTHLAIAAGSEDAAAVAMPTPAIGSDGNSAAAAIWRPSHPTP